MGGCNFIHETPHGVYTVSADNDRPAYLGFGMDQVKCSPSLGPGDLVLFRGDVFHRTQPHNSYRTSLNVVVRPGIPTLKLENQMRGGNTKYEWMAMHPYGYTMYHPGREKEFFFRLWTGSLIRRTLFPVRH